MSTNMTQPSHGEYTSSQITTSPARQPQIAEAFDILEKTALAHEELCAELEKRLSDVLRHEPEAAEADSTGEPKCTVVGVASRINNISDRLHRIGNSLNSILRRLEL